MQRAQASGRMAGWSVERIEFFRTAFFGRLEIRIEPGRSKSWFPDENAEDAPWELHSIKPLGDGRFLFMSRSAESGESYSREFALQREHDCYTVEQPELGFREWFCRMQSPDSVAD